MEATIIGTLTPSTTSRNLKIYEPSQGIFCSGSTIDLSLQSVECLLRFGWTTTKMNKLSVFVPLCCSGFTRDFKIITLKAREYLFRGRAFTFLDSQSKNIHRGPRQHHTMCSQRRYRLSDNDKITYASQDTKSGYRNVTLFRAGQI